MTDIEVIREALWDLCPNYGRLPGHYPEVRNRALQALERLAEKERAGTSPDPSPPLADILADGIPGCKVYGSHPMNQHGECITCGKTSEEINNEEAN